MMMLERIIDLLIFYSPTILIMIIAFMVGRVWWKNT